MSSQLAAAAASEDSAPVQVTARPLSELSVTLRGSAPATVVSLNRTQVAARLAATISSIEVVVGDTVVAGATLATLDCTEYRQELARNEALLDAYQARRELADQQLARALKLLPTRNISEEQVNQRRAEFEAAEAEIVAQRAQIAISRRQVQYCTIASPFDGVVVERLSSEGAYVSPGTPVVEVLGTNRDELDSRIPVDATGSLSSSAATFQTEDAQYSVSLRTMLPLIDETSRSRRARFSFDDERPLAGTPGRLVWVTEPDAVPAHLVVSRPEGLGVYVAEGDRARFVVLPDALPGRPASTGLPPDALIIVEGRYNIVSGSRIAVNAS